KKWESYARSEQHKNNAHNGQNARKRIHQRIRHEFLNIGNIARHTLNDVTLLLFAVPIKRKALQVFKETLTQPRAQVLCQKRSKVKLNICQDCAQYGEENENDDRGYDDA